MTTGNRNNEWEGVGGGGGGGRGRGEEMRDAMTTESIAIGGKDGGCHDNIRYFYSN